MLKDTECSQMEPEKISLSLRGPAHPHYSDKRTTDTLCKEKLPFDVGRGWVPGMTGMTAGLRCWENGTGIAHAKSNSSHIMTSEGKPWMAKMLSRLWNMSSLNMLKVKKR